MTKHIKFPPHNDNDQEDLSLSQPSSDTLTPHSFLSFWNKNRKQILPVIVLIVAIFASFEIWDLYQKKNDEYIQQKFQNATTLEQRTTFAESHPKHPLAGLAFLSAADQSYENHSFNESAKYYQKSLSPLKKTPLASRALLGLALSKIQLGEQEAGHKLLEKVINDKDALNVFKAEASFQLANMALEADDYAAAKHYLKSVESFPFSGIWSQKAEILMQGQPNFN